MRFGKKKPKIRKFLAALIIVLMVVSGLGGMVPIGIVSAEIPYRLGLQLDHYNR